MNKDEWRSPHLHLFQWNILCNVTEESIDKEDENNYQFSYNLRPWHIVNATRKGLLFNKFVLKKLAVLNLICSRISVFVE
jgi:hypothetical protein